VALVEQWISSAAAPFRRRLAGEWPDVVQEVRVEAFRLLQMARWRGAARLKTYLWRVTNHTCIDALRRQKRRPLHDPAEPDAVPSSDPSPLDSLIDNDSLRAMVSALESLPSDCRELWRLILEGMSYAAISRQTGVSEGALRVRACRCRKRAAEALAGNGLNLRVAQR